MRHETRDIHTLEDCVRLFAALGYAPTWAPLPPTAAGPTPGAAVVLAQHGAFAWLGIESPTPRVAAGRAVRQLERSGRSAGVLAIDTVGRRIALAVTGDATCLELSLDAPSAIGLAALERLRPLPGERALAQQFRYADALRGRGVDRAFFLAFRHTLDRVIDVLPPAMAAADRHGIALLQLTRVLFLYFVQAQGWLDGRADFIARGIDDVLRQRRSIHKRFLRPLFFGTLNRPRDRRSGAARRFGAVPFLNGGLFEPHALERRWRIVIDNDVWRHAFDALFERFHFTIDERDDTGVAPDMLGHVFEGVMDPDSRHASGSFYTPATLVGRMLDVALPVWVGGRLGIPCEDAERRLLAGDADALRALTSVTVLDPAAGSGAFLLGALDRLADAHMRLGAPPAAAHRAVLSRQLFGVDRNPAAVRLAELRLWLRVLAADDAAGADDVAPLPNLDALVRQGDMLLDPIGALAPLPRATAQRLADLRATLVNAHGDAKRTASRALAMAERAHTDGALCHAEAVVEREIRERLQVARACGLFGERTGLDRTGQRALALARQRRRQVRLERRRLRTDGELPWFHCESQFADVAARGGFDLVVGNPPWVRAEALSAPLRDRLRERYVWWSGGGRSGPGFRHGADLSIAFLERAFEVLHPRGVIAFLLPAKLATAEYAQRARGALAERHTVHAAAVLDDGDAHFDATVYPLVLVAGAARAMPGHRLRLGLAPTADRVAQSVLGPGPWVLRHGGVDALLAEVAARHPRLDSTTRCALGVKTGADRLFLTDGRGIEPELLRWAIRGRDVAPFAVRRAVHLIWTHGADGRAMPLLPRGATRHFRPHLERLRARSDYQRGPAWSLFRTHAASATHRVVWADLAPRLEAVALGPPVLDGVPLNTCLVAPMRDAVAARRLAAWLNAPPIDALARLNAPPAAGGCARYAAHVVGALPLPTTVLDDATIDTTLPLAEPARTAALTDIALRHLDLGSTERARLAALVARRADDRRGGSRRHA